MSSAPGLGCRRHLEGRGRWGWTKGSTGSSSQLDGLGLLGLASTDLASRLVEPRGHALLSVLVEVRPQDRAIPAGLHGCGRKASSEGSRRGKLLSYIIIFQYLRYSGDTFFFF